MSKLLSLILTSLVIVIHGLAQMEHLTSGLNALVEAERAFSRASVANGLRAAFLEYLADDAVVFRPRAVNGKRWYREQPDNPGLLTWEPVFADISRAGDLGYTTGPWEFRNNKSDVQPAAYGHYVSIWKKQPDGSWRVRIDVGISHAKPELKATEVGSPARVRTPSRARVKDERMAVLRAERALSNISSRKGMAAALQAYAADDVRLYRPDNVPFIGKTAAQAALEKSVDDVTWQPTLIEVAQSGDLAYCYGTAMSKMRGAKHAMSTSSYMRIWKKQPSGRWNVVLDISNPIPPESKP